MGHRSLAAVLTGWMAVLTVALPAAAATHNDQPCHRLEMRDGRTLTGRIVAERGTTVSFELWVGDLRAPMTLPRRQIVSITEVDCGGSDETTDTDDRESPSDGGQSTSGSGGGPEYMLIPIEGYIGFDPTNPTDECVTAEGLREALEKARGAGVSHVVLLIDSPGGFTREGERLGEIIAEHQQEYGDKLPIVTAIKSADGSALWAAFASSRVFVLSGGSLGQGLERLIRAAYANDDAKALQSWINALVDWAESRGHNPDVVRSLLSPPVELWATPDFERPSGWSLSGEQVSGNSIQLDGPNTLALLTSK